jgi:hypothetical protein
LSADNALLFGPKPVGWDAIDNPIRSAWISRERIEEPLIFLQSNALASLQGVVKTFNKDLEAMVDAAVEVILKIYVVDIEFDDVACFLVEEDSINERCFGIQ